MIKYFPHNKIDKKRWDAAIDNAHNGMVYAKSWYLDIVSPQWEALIEENYSAVFPLTWRKKYNIHYLHQPFFTQQLGVFSFDKNNFSEKFIQSIPAKYKFIEINLNTENKFEDMSWKIKNRLTHHLDLNKYYEEIQNNYSENLLRNIKKAKKNLLKIKSEVDVKELIHLFRNNKGADVSNLKEKDYSTLKELIAEGSKRKLIFSHGICNEKNKLIAGAIFIKSNHEYIFHFSATDNEAKEKGAMSLIIDDFIQTHSSEKMKLDFEGSMDKNLARFYKSFGSKEVVYLHIRKNNLPAPLRWIKK